MTQDEFDARKEAIMHLGGFLATSGEFLLNEAKCKEMEKEEGAFETEEISILLEALSMAVLNQISKTGKAFGLRISVVVQDRGTEEQDKSVH